MSTYRIQHWDNIRQRWKDWHNTQDYPTLEIAKQEAERHRRRWERDNVRRDRDNRPDSFGSSWIPPMRIVLISGGQIIEKQPATEHDRKMFQDKQVREGVYLK